MRWKLIVFDWDGTLMDSTGRIVAIAQTAIATLGYPPLPAEAIRNIIGLGLKECWATLYPELPEAGYTQFVRVYREHFRSKEFPLSDLFPGVVDLLEALSGDGHTLAVATGKGRSGLDMEMDATDTRRFFSVTRTVDEAASKPQPEMLEAIMEFTGAAAGETLMVGDTEYDLQMARNAGVQSVGVSYGAHSRDRLLAFEPLACLDSVGQIGSWLRGSNRSWAG